MAGGFVPDGFDATIWENIQPLTNDLMERQLSCSSCIEGLISDSSELAEHISETGALLYIGMTCDTESEGKKESFLDFMSNIRPKLSEFSDALNRRIVNHSSVDDLPSRYDLMLRGMRTDVEIFRKAEGFGLPTVQIDGTNVLDVFECTQEAVARARKGKGPTFVEALTYRWRGHGGAGDDSASGYRDPEEVKHWEQFCPINGLYDYLITMNLYSKKDKDFAEK